MYSLHEVTKTYLRGRKPIKALREVDLEIEAGQFVAVQGPTGGGKSTLLNLLGGLDRPTSGSVRLDGTDLATMRAAALARVRARTAGFVFQTFNLIPTLTARQNVETALVPLGVSAKERIRRAQEALGDLGMADRASHLPAELSGGQQQRVAIARALVKQPTVLLADEPTGNLDEAMRDEIVGVLEGLWGHGLTIVLVTHDSTVAARAQRRLWIERGRLREHPAA